MQKLSKLLFFFVLGTLYFVLHPLDANAQVPELLLECSETRPNEFHSLRPYQAAPCGGAPQALFCSNKLVIFEDFELAYKCQKYRKYETGTVQCDPNYHVDAHNLNITLDESEFPIMGNTEDEFDDAQKLNEYASWYLNGVIDKKENPEATDEQIVNFSGPVRKLVPAMIQDAQRISILRSTTEFVKEVSEETGEEINDAANHDQIVVDNLRLSSWRDGDLSFFRIAALAWDKRFPPLPWDDGTTESIGVNVGTGETTYKPRPFKSQILYQKAYNEWLGKSCLILPIIGLQCADIKIPTLFGSIDVITNKYADLWHFVPLSNNSDKKGKNYLLTGDGPSYVPSQGTEIGDAQHKSYKNAPLYFAHTQEVASMSALLNQTFRPAGYESEPVPTTTERITQKDGLDCSAVNVRTNKGDDLFPGDRPSGKELYVEGAEYDITSVECDEVHERVEIKCKDPNVKGPCYKVKDSFVCNAEVGIEFKLGTQTPFANEIFADTVADSGSTFRKIFPKVEEGAPVSCIADIPTVTNVTYSIDNPLNQGPNGGEQTFKQTKYPEDSAGSNPELTFPHIGSVYEYFLKGIQTALRPKGYGEPIANGNCAPLSDGSGICKQWLFEKNKGGQFYYDKIIAAASSTKCNGKSLNPFWAIGIALNENGGLMTDDLKGLSKSHFGCNMSQLQTIEDKISCMTNTLRNDCLAGKTDEATLQEYGYALGYELHPIKTLDPGGIYPPPLFGSGFNVDQLKTNLINTDWRAYYAPVAKIFCPTSPSLPY